MLMGVTGWSATLSIGLAWAANGLDGNIIGAIAQGSALAASVYAAKHLVVPFLSTTVPMNMFQLGPINLVGALVGAFVHVGLQALINMRAPRFNGRAILMTTAMIAAVEYLGAFLAGELDTSSTGEIYSGV